MDIFNIPFALKKIPQSSKSGTKNNSSSIVLFNNLQKFEGLMSSLLIPIVLFFLFVLKHWTLIFVKILGAWRDSRAVARGKVRRIVRHSYISIDFGLIETVITSRSDRKLNTENFISSFSRSIKAAFLTD